MIEDSILPEMKKKKKTLIGSFANAALCFVTSFIAILLLYTTLDPGVGYCCMINPTSHTCGRDTYIQLVAH